MAVGFELELSHMPFLIQEPKDKKEGASTICCQDVSGRVGSKNKKFIIKGDDAYGTVLMKWKGILDLTIDHHTAGRKTEDKKKMQRYAIPEIIIHPFDINNKDELKKLKRAMQCAGKLVEIIRIRMHHGKITGKDKNILHRNISLKELSEGLKKAFPDETGGNSISIKKDNSELRKSYEDLCIGLSRKSPFTDIIYKDITQKEPIDRISTQVTFGCDIKNMNKLLMELKSLDGFMSHKWLPHIKVAEQKLKDFKVKNYKIQMLNKWQSNSLIKKAEWENESFKNLEGLLLLLAYYYSCAKTYEKKFKTTKNFAGLLFHARLEKLHQRGLNKVEKKFYAICKIHGINLEILDAKGPFQEPKEKVGCALFSDLTTESVYNYVLNGAKQKEDDFNARERAAEVVGSMSQGLSCGVPCCSVRGKKEAYDPNNSEYPYRIPEEEFNKNRIMFEIAKGKTKHKYKCIGQQVELRSFDSMSADASIKTIFSTDKEKEIGIFKSQNKTSFFDNVIERLRIINSSSS